MTFQPNTNASSPPMRLKQTDPALWHWLDAQVHELVWRNWFPKQRALGSGVSYDSLDRVTATGSGIDHGLLSGRTDADHVAGSIAFTATDRLLGRDTAAAGAGEELTVGGGVEFTGSGGIQRSALSGDVTASAGSGTTTIANNAVTDAKLRDSAAVSVIGRAANSTGDPADIAAGSNGQILGRRSNALTFAQVTLTSEVTGTLPIANGGTSNTSAGTAFAALSPQTTKGDLIVAAGAADDRRHAVGADATALIADSTQTLGVKWGTQALACAVPLWMGTAVRESLSSGGGAWTARDATVAGTAGSENAYMIGAQFVTAATNLLAITWLTPADMDVTKSATIVVYGDLGGAPGASDNLRLYMNAAQKSDNGALSDTSVNFSFDLTTAIGSGGAGYSNGDTFIITLGTISANTLTVKRPIVSSVGRKAAASNEYGSSIRVGAVWLEYTALGIA